MGHGPPIHIYFPPLVSFFVDFGFSRARLKFEREMEEAGNVKPARIKTPRKQPNPDKFGSNEFKPKERKALQNHVAALPKDLGPSMPFTVQTRHQSRQLAAKK